MIKEIKELEPKNLRGNPAAIAEYLTEVFSENNFSDTLEALQLVMRAQNVKALSETTGMRRDGLYKVFCSRGDPRLSKVLRLFEGLNVRVTFEALPARQTPQRPKLGRPLSSKRFQKMDSATS
jgi:probable addiction module antidote protein